MKILLLALLSVISAIAYRGGGQSKDLDSNPKWMPMWMRKSWIRDWLCPLFVYGSFAILFSPSHLLQWGMLVICYPLLGGALSTYLDSIFGFDNFWAAGFLCGIVAFPLLFCGIAWWMILIRAIILAVLWGGWCSIFSKDTTEEYGRGAFLVLTIPLLLI